MPLSLPSYNLDRHNSLYHSKFSKRTIEIVGPSLGRPPKQPLPPIPSFPSERASHSRYIKRRTRQKERELIEIQKISLQAAQPRNSLTLPTFQWIRGTMIGKGSQGKVYMALNVTTGEIMAVKQVERPRSTSDGKELRRIADSLREEQETLKDLDHPNVVQYLGFEENHQTLNIFLEYVSGGTIDSCVKTFGRLQEDVTKYFTRQILEGLAYLHSEGILHRDLKAANILVMDSGICKISDFGISKRNQRAWSFAGTSYCMAPETLSPGRDGYDVKVDIWSVGCVVQQMWTASRTWSNVDFLSIWCRLGEGELPPLPSDVSLSMLAHHFRQECFQIEPTRRPSAAFLLIHPYLELPPGWEFPGMRALGCVSSAANPSRGDKQHLNADTHAPASILQDMQAIAMRSMFMANSPANKSSELLPVEQPPPSPRPLPSPPSYTTNPRPLPSPPPSPAPVRLRSKGSSSSIASASSSGIYCDHPRCNSSKITPIPESEDSDGQLLPLPRKASKPVPFSYTPPPLPDPQFPYSSHLLPPTRYIDARTRYPEALLRKAESNPEISSLPITRSQRAHSASAAEPRCVANETVAPNACNMRSRWSKPLPLPPSLSSSLPSPLLFSLSQTSPRPLPVPRVPSPPCYYDDTTLSSLTHSGSTWQRPPTNLANRQTGERRGTHTVPPLPTSPVNTTRAKATSRPDIREVVKKLDDYFPEHNLDAPVVMENDDDDDEESPILTSFMREIDSEFRQDMGIYDAYDLELEPRRASVETRRSRKRTMKSIKSIAEENILDHLSDNFSTRRQTKCWNSRVEEIKVPW